MGVSDLPQFISSVKGRLDKGRSVKYALSAAEAEGLGANVHGMEGAAEKGDVEAVLGHALAVPTVMAAGYGLARGAPAIADAAAPALKRAVRPIADSATAVGDSLDPDLVGLVSPRAAHALRLARKVGTVATKIDAKINPETPAATAAAAAPQTPAVQPAPGATTPAAQPVTKPALTAAGFQEAKAMGRIPTAADSTPRTLSGESALRKVLTGQDNANLLKIAKSRGVNVTRESQLKPGSADNLLINKIVEDFKPEELDELSARYLEGSRFKHDFGDIGPEAWKTMSLQTYFPELKISQTAVARTHAAILRSAASRLEKTAPATKTTPAADAGDLTSILQESVKRAKTLKELQ